MLVHFSGASGGQPEPRPAPVSNLGMPYLSPALVNRHGGRVLQPADAAIAPGARPPAATAYRANTLLIPDSVLRNASAVAAIDQALATVGLELEIPPPLIESAPSLRPWLRELADVPRAVVLRVRDDAGPTSVDAWVALQAIRAATRRDGLAETLPVSADTSRIGLDHLLSAATITGNPFSE